MSGHGSHEKTDAKAKPLVMFALVLSVLTAIAMVLCFGMYRGMEFGWEYFDKKPHPLAQSDSIEKDVLLQTNTSTDLEAHEAHEEFLLNHYGWVSEDASIVRIPIEQAKELSLKRDLFQVRSEMSVMEIEAMEEQSSSIINYSEETDMSDLGLTSSSQGSWEIDEEKMNPFHEEEKDAH